MSKKIKRIEIPKKKKQNDEKGEAGCLGFIAYQLL